MGWKIINGLRYCCKSERVGARVKTTYFGAGESGTITLVFGDDKDGDQVAGAAIAKVSTSQHKRR